MLFGLSVDFVFFKFDFFEKFSQKYHQSVKQVLNPDQARSYVGPDLGPNGCKGYQQTALVGKALYNNNNNNNNVDPLYTSES